MAVIWAVVLLAFLVVVYWKVPEAIPGLAQRGLGLVFAALAAAVYFQLTREPDLQDDLVARMERGQHLDFGKQLRAVKHEHRRVNLPVLGETTIRAIVGVVLVASAFGWWLTPFAPVAVAQRRIEDVSGPLTDEIIAVILVCPDGELAVAQPPTRPMLARRLAAKIPDTAPTMVLARKAISLGKYKLARAHLISAAAEEDIGPLEIDVAKAQCEMYAGDFKAASVCYKNALDREPHNPTILAQAAVAALHAGDYHKAQQLIALAVKICRAAGPDEAVRLATCTQIRAALFTIIGYRYDIVEKNNQQALELWLDEEFPEHHPGKAACLNNQGVLFTLTGNLPGARSMNARAIDQWKNRELRSPRLAAGLGNRAVRLHWEGKYVESQEAADDELAMLRNTLPIGHPVIAIGMNNAAVADLALAEYQRAEPDDVKALVTSFEKRLGRQSPAVAAAMNTVAASYLTVALPAKARSYCEQALAVTEASLGAKHPYMITGLLGLGRVFLQQGRYDQATDACHRASRIAEDVFGKDHVTVARCRLLEGKILSAQGKGREARPFFEQTLAISKKCFGDMHPLAAEALAGLAASENGPRALKKGIARCNEAIGIHEQLLGPRHEEHPAVARLLFAMAKLNAKQGNIDEALALLARCLAIQENALVPYDPQLADTLVAQAKLLRRQKTPDDDSIQALEKRAERIRREHDEENRH